MSNPKLHHVLFEAVLNNLQLILKHYYIKPIMSCRNSFDLQGVTFFTVTFSRKTSLGEW